MHRLLPLKCSHEEGFLPVAKNSRGAGKSSVCWLFFMPGPEVWILADQDGQTVEAVHCIYHCNLGFFKCDNMPFGLCNMPATFEWLMQNCLRELNLTHCLIYLDDIIIFSQMAEEHLHHLWIVFD